MSNHTPTTLSESDKFDGSNWAAWKNLITIAAKVHGAMGYLDGTIPEPSQDPKEDSTTWDNTNPLIAEWRARNTWAKGLLLYNTHNPIGLGVNISGSATNAWKS
ncbi:hypothetical protein P691DRAFT_634726, partial [Macrolepiota fuliginosa MF-IS2]